jgi:hypothetical protein
MAALVAKWLRETRKNAAEAAKLALRAKIAVIQTKRAPPR